jgi:hypothetical protein
VPPLFQVFHHPLRYVVVHVQMKWVKLIVKSAVLDGLSDILAPIEVQNDLEDGRKNP